MRRLTGSARRALAEPIVKTFADKDYRATPIAQASLVLQLIEDGRYSG